ncbi:copper transporter [Myceligenerans pegani]|uniref:Copper transporter n=1 Tax=Myceligenerans pegani TaxID=2776917 RepID=A0ABR9N4D0_9MICO|nr:copper transporter [Myceligenerans sp. TRM 65318]MBE1878518.1 copper transporter [Myceligenerans sp. TRM 65318]MBE3020789.1 copper transporter [Myceligenerans sp. TRM 65318]
MIDFRYHLVSLISVFLALAVGIILGAGPLQGALGETLTRQVDTLREERNVLRAELDDTSARLAADEAFLVAAAPRLLEGTLTGRRVAVVGLGDVPSGVRSGVIDQLEAAGADVVVSATLPENWTDIEEEAARTTVADGLRAPLAEAGVETDEDDPIATLGSAVTLALTGTESAGGRSAAALDLEQQLDTFGLLRTADEQSLPANAVVLLSGTAETVVAGDVETEAADEVDGGDEAGDAETATVELANPRYVGDVWTAVTLGVEQVAGTAVLAGPGTGGNEVVQRVRSDDDLSREVSTVSEVTQLASRITVPLALAAALTGNVDHYGPEPDTAVLPPVPEE